MVAWAQWPMPYQVPEVAPLSLESMPAIELAETEATIAVSGQGFAMSWDRATGRLSSWTQAGAELLVDGPVFNAWRAPTDNDLTPRRNNQIGNDWLQAGLDRLEHGLDDLTAEALGPQAARIVATTTVAAPADVAALPTHWDGTLAQIEQAVREFVDDATLKRAMLELGLDPDGFPADKAARVKQLVAQMDQAERIDKLLGALNAASEPGSMLRRHLGRYLGLPHAALKEAAGIDYPPARFKVTYIYTACGSGDLLIETDVQPLSALPHLPKLGLQMQVAGDYDTMTWYGRGPHETYVDRKLGAAFGVYSGSVDEQYVPYIKPQENGNKTDVYWVALTDGAGQGLLAMGQPTIETSAHHYSTENLAQADHTYALNWEETITWKLDYAQAGLGGGSCGPATRPEYMLPPDPVRFAVRLRPVTGDDTPLMSINKTTLPKV